MTLITLYFAISLFTFLVGLQTLVFYPLSLVYAFRKQNEALYKGKQPLVSIIVPAYNEASVISNCVQSILNSDYTHFELILVNDGSSDDTLAQMQQFADDGRVIVIDKPNGGKASALNAGLEVATGQVLFFVDADGVFRRDTIQVMLEGFRSSRVGAVCGNDSPVNLDRLQTQLLSIQTHATTGFVRRALAMMNCLPIVSGNIGAFRRDVLAKTGPFREGFIGEDLELTWRVHRAGYRVEFQPHAIVYAEVPSTLTALWKQRVRWARGLLQTAWIHRDMFFNPKFLPISLYLPFNFLAMAVVPIAQLATIILLITLIALGRSPLSLDGLTLITWLGLGTAYFTSIFAIALDRAWRDLVYLYVIPLWVFYSVFINAVAFWALVLELSGTTAVWNKLTRTGVVSRRDTSLETA